MNDGILLLKKDKNITSNAIINKIKYQLKNKGIRIDKIGHAGTLDPNAEGLLVVLINGVTKLSDYLLLNDKEYIAEIELGRSYDTLDVWGKLEEEISLNEDNLKEINERIDDVLASFIGEINQIPPMYSSIKIEGRRLYQIARDNEIIDLSDKIRKVKIFSLIRLNEPTLTTNHTIRFKIKCKVSKGTYIRSLAKSIGEKLNLPSCMSSLIRTKSGKYKIEDAYSVDDVLIGKYQLINMLDCLDDFYILDADDKIYNDCINGRYLHLNLKEEQIAIKYQEELIAIYELDKDNNYYKAKRVWK